MLYRCPYCGMFLDKNDWVRSFNDGVSWVWTCPHCEATAPENDFIIKENIHD